MVRKKAYKIIFLTLTLFLGFNNVKAQYASEDELKKAANNFFEEQDYVKALPLFSQLLSLYPKDPNYNYKYGASYLFAKREKEDAVKYLKFGASNPNVDPQAYYYLALAQQHNYQFTVAQVNYNKFKQKGTPKDVAELEVDRKIEMCKNGLKLLKSMTEIGVLYKKEIRASDFFRSYDLKGIGGKVIVKPDEFKTKLDIKKNETSLIHLGDNPKMAIFSSYGNDGKNGKDIYRVIKMPNGDWSKPAPIGEGINTKFDEDYPFLHPDGKTLYFSSKGYNSMGGYDIFKSELNPETGQWSTPENLDFPINTPDDDILFISDIDNQLAFFASSRASMQGELTVYKVKVDPLPSGNSIVKGIFIAESNPAMKSATISIVDVEKERTYGIYKTDKDNGGYILVFPGNGGKYKILVETTSNSPIHSAVIELPVLDGFRALKQELRLVGEGDDEKLVVKNLFDETDEFDMTDPLIVENLLKVKAQLNVNMTEQDLLASQNSTDNSSELSYADLSDEELVSTSAKKADNIIEKAKISRNQANYTYDLANKKSNEAKQLFAEFLALEKEAEQETDVTIKQNKLDQAKETKMKAAGLVNETLAALNLARAIESEATEIESDLNNVNKTKENVTSNISSGNREEAETNYAELEKIADAAYMKKSSLVTEKELANDKLTEKEIAYNKARNEVIELTNREIEIKGDIENAEEKLANANKKNDKENIETQISAFKIDLADVQYDLGVAETTEQQLKVEYNTLKNTTNIFNNVASMVSENGADNSTQQTADKLALDNDIIYFEKQGLVGLYPEETTSQNTENNAVTENEFDLNEHKDEYSIVNDEGEIIDYNTQYSSELVDVDNANDGYQKSLELAKINQNWALAIDEEIEIKEKQLAVTTDLNSKINLTSEIDQLKTLKESKQKEANKQLAFAEVLSGGNEPEVTTDNVEAVNITDESGNVVDYDTQYENELAALEGDDDNNKKVEVYKNWVNAIEQEVLLKKVEMNEVEGDDKTTIENRINELETKLQENQEWIALYESQSAEETSLENETQLTDNPSESNNNAIAESNTSNSELDLSKYNSDVVSETGEVKDYSSNYQNQLTEADNIVDEITATNKKQEITQNWINSIDDEIEYQEDLLVSTTNETEQEAIKAKINDLNALKNDKQEELVNYQLALANNETNNTASNNVAVNNKSALDYTTSPEDENLNVSYNTEYPYRATQANRELSNVKELKRQANDLYTQSEEKNNSLSAIDDMAEREAVIKEADDLKKSAQQKELEIAKTYEKTNKSEFYNNQEAISKVKSSASVDSQNATVAELLEGEAYTYFGQAEAERDKAENAESFTSKESALQKAYNLELQALEKQTKAIELYANNTNLEEVYASLPVTNNLPETNNNTATNNQPEINESSTNNTETNTASDNQEYNESAIYQPLAISLPSDEDRNNAKRLEKEAEVLEVRAKELNDSAEVVTNKKEKNDLIAEADNLIAQADQKRKEAEVYYANAESKKNEDAILMDELNENRSDLSNEKITTEDEAVLASISGDELNTITQSNNYKTYSDAKKESRRLIKEAEVDYIKADKFQQEVEDEKTLGISLNALAAGAEGERKTKLLGQIEKLKGMIADNEAKAIEARNSATEKEKNALAKTKEAEAILTNNSDEAQKIAAIEKAEVYNNELLAEVKNNTAPVANNTETTNQVEEPIVDNTPVEEIVDNTPEVNNETTNQVEEPIVDNTPAEEIVDNTPEVNNETTNQVEEPIVDNTPEVNNEATTTEPSNVNVDEIPEVLTNEIFVLTPNKAAYSSSKPIPVAEKLPEGLVFKVQIGAFRNTIPQDHFKGFAPIMAEDAGNGITRYTAGFFKTFNMANEAKNSIRTIGYSDAFVVAFFNGKRININEARAMMNDDVAVNNNTNESTNTNNVVNNVSNDNSTNEIPEATTDYEEVVDGVSTDVHKIAGVFFTIQVGVYSKPVTADQLSNVTPLNSEKTANGLIRYTSGVYKTLNEANQAKDRIRNLGITDAFVIAYANGNRVGVQEAVGYLNNSSSDDVSTDVNNSNSNPNNATPEEVLTQPENNNPSITTNTNNTTSSSTNELPDETNNNTTSPEVNNTVTETNKEPIDQVKIGKELKLEFKVLLGEYTEDVPVDDAAIFLKLSGQGMTNYEENGVSIYTIGSYPDYPSALDMQLKMKDEGVKKPKVVAYRDGTQIEIDEALELVKNNSK